MHLQVHIVIDLEGEGARATADALTRSEQLLADVRRSYPAARFSVRQIGSSTRRAPHRPKARFPSGAVHFYEDL